jgi:quercetin dioxygenase-like cupin family protein
MKITSLERVEMMRVEMEGAQGAYKQVPLSKKDGAPTFSFRVFTTEPNGHTPIHKHPFEHLNYVIEGCGALVTEEGKEHKVKQGDFVLVLPNEKHQYKNTSSKGSFIIICAVPKEYE